MSSVVLITGANAGVGLALAHRLLEEQGESRLTIVLACRNAAKAQEAKDALLMSHPHASVDVLQVDVGNVGSVLRAAAEFRKRYTRLDMLFLNAGIMPAAGVDWAAILRPSLSHFAALFNSGSQVMRQHDSTTAEGLREVFATNAFGHFVLIEELRDLMEATTRDSNKSRLSGTVVFTSSRAAQPLSLDLADLQHSKGRDPYGSSKRVVDLLCLGLNRESSPLRFHSACPGLVVSQLTFALLAPWLWTVLTPLLWLCRLLSPSLTLSPRNGAEVLAWLSRDVRDVQCKYLAACGPLGSLSVHTKPLDDAHHQAEPLLAAMRQLSVDMRKSIAEKKK